MPDDLFKSKRMEQRMINRNMSDFAGLFSPGLHIKKREVCVTIRAFGRTAPNLFNSQLIFQHRG
jgi:hypothetical protein